MKEVHVTKYVCEGCNSNNKCQWLTKRICEKHEKTCVFSMYARTCLTCKYSTLIKYNNNRMYVCNIKQHPFLNKNCDSYNYDLNKINSNPYYVDDADEEDITFTNIVLIVEYLSYSVYRTNQGIVFLKNQFINDKPFIDGIKCKCVRLDNYLVPIDVY